MGRGADAAAELAARALPSCWCACPKICQYYVEAGGIKSRSYKLHTIDLPAVKNINVTYNYPSWTGMASVTEDPGGDLRAVEGTVAKVEIQTDKPLTNAQIVFEEGKPINLDSTARTTAPSTNIPIEKDGTYHIAVMDHGELVRLTDDYFIEARKAGQPTVHITKPGKDAKVSPIEEVTVAVTGEDDYPLQELDLHYSVNGAPEKVDLDAEAEGREEGGGHDDAFDGRFQARSRRHRQHVRNRARRQEFRQDGHVLHPGRAVRVRVLAVAGRWRRWWRRQAIRNSRFPSAKRKSSRPRSIS